MVEVIGVRFKKVGKIYYFDPDGVNIPAGTPVIVETARGVEYGFTEIGNRPVADGDVVQPLKKVIRIATEDDAKQEAKNRETEKDAFVIGLEKIKNHGLDMKLVDVEMTFDLNKIVFYFTSDGRVDFRELVKDLAAVFRMRIELRQIGVRDEAKILNGIGICGRGLCCASFLGEFQPVSIKMAKEQGMSLNPTKISGICGRLMCCLKYEEDTYEALNRNLPFPGDIVSTPDGNGEILSVNILRQIIKAAVRKKATDDAVVGYYALGEIKVLEKGRLAMVHELEQNQNQNDNERAKPKGEK
ncbi:MAG: stage 0 sporulation family protein [Firmicutes bacterium]|nr:stage 0 sporulation family protein [Bacillota bacterium]